MLVIYLHGFRSTGNSGKTQTLKAMFPEHRVIGCDYSPHSPKRAKRQLKDLMATESKLSESKDGIVVIGTSLGGFWSRWMAKEFGIRALMINPSLHPDKTLKAGRYELYNESKTIITVTEDDLESFNDFKVSAEEANNLNCNVWVAMDDELLDANAIVEELGHLHNLTTFESGGHRFCQFGEMKEKLSALVSGSA